MTVTQTLPNVANIARVWKTSEKIWLPVWRDTSDALIASSAGFLPVKPYYEQYTIGCIHAEIFKPYSDAQYAAELDTLNSIGFKGFDPYQCWMSEIHVSEEKVLGNATGHEVHYVVRCLKRTDGWRFQHPDVGYVYDDGANIKSFLSTDGMPYIGNLDGAGDDGGTTMQIILSDTKDTLNFNSLGI